MLLNLMSRRLPVLFLKTPKLASVLCRVPGRGFTTTTTTTASTTEDGSNSSDDNQSTASSSTNKKEYVYGTVKNYIRERAYGFIKPDTGGDNIGNNNDDTIYIHRSGIKSAKLVPPNFSVKGSANSVVATIPYLRRNERVRFFVVEEPAEKGPLKAARELEFEDGTQIPIYRPGYVANYKTHCVGVLGEVIYQEMNNNDDETVADEAAYAKIQQSYETAKQAIAKAQARFDAMNTLIQKMK
jgi:cold shock CspA family protein